MGKAQPLLTPLPTWLGPHHWALKSSSRNQHKGGQARCQSPGRLLAPQRSPWSLLISGLTLAPEPTPRAHHPFLGTNQLLSKPSPRPARRLPQPPDLWPRRRPGCFVYVTSSSCTFPSLVTDSGPQSTGEGIPAPGKPPSPGAFPTQRICPPEPLRAHCRSAHTRHLERATRRLRSCPSNPLAEMEGRPQTGQPHT